MNPADMSHATVPFDEFLKSFKTRMHNVFHDREDMNRLSTGRGLPPYVLREVMACNPLSVFIPAEYGGRGPDPREGIAVIEAASYESLALALIFGINWALFLQPVAKYGQEKARQQVFDGFLSERKMGGLMITEPDYGSDALHMQTAWSEQDGLCHLRGTKHWAGLTGWADYWLLTARKSGGPRGLARDIDFFVCDANAPGQHVVVEERYNNLGLYMIPYGRNRIDVKIPATHRLLPHSTGIKMMLDLLHRSRMQFPSMAMGFLTRLLDEAVARGKPVWDVLSGAGRLSGITPAVREAIAGYERYLALAPEAEDRALLELFDTRSGRAFVLLSPFITQRLEAFWPDPLRFDPERFAPASARGRHPFAWFPFSAGPRVCIGKRFSLYEAQLVLAMVMRAFRVRMETRKVGFKAEGTLHPDRPLMARLEPRS